MEKEKLREIVEEYLDWVGERYTEDSSHYFSFESFIYWLTKNNIWRQ